MCDFGVSELNQPIRHGGDSIYAMLNLAWNSRRDKTFVVTKSAVERRRYFSWSLPIFERESAFHPDK